MKLLRYILEQKQLKKNCITHEIKLLERERIKNVLPIDSNLIIINSIYSHVMPSITTLVSCIKTVKKSLHFFHFNRNKQIFLILQTPI